MVKFINVHTCRFFPVVCAGLLAMCVGGVAEANSSTPSNASSNPEPLCFNEGQGLGIVCPPTTTKEETPAGGNVVSTPDQSQTSSSDVTGWDALLEALFGN